MFRSKAKPLQKSRSCYDLTPEQIYSIVSGTDNAFGIEGYKCPKRYFDYHKEIWNKKRAEILKKHRREWPPENWPKDKENDKKVPPKRWNFIDDQVRWANSFNDRKKSEEVRQALEDKGKKIPTETHPYKSDFDKKKNNRNLFKEFKEREEQLKNIRKQILAIPEFKQEAISQVEEKIKNGENYQPKKGYSNWPKCDRVMYSSEGEYLGEQIPFYNPNTKEEDKKKQEFFPNKIKIMRRYPIWSIGPKKEGSGANTHEEASQYIKARDERLEEKANAVFEKWRIDRKGFMDDAVKSYDMVHRHGHLPLVIRKPYDYASTEQYKTAMENKKGETPAPNCYWDDGKAKIKMRLNVEDDQAQRYVMPREKTYKRLYVSGMRKSVF